MPKTKNSFLTFLHYAAVGGLGTAVHYVVLYVLVEAFLVSPVGASAAGALCGAGVNYLLNRHLTFKSEVSHRKAAPRFFLVAGLAALVNTFLMWVLVRQWGLPYMLAQLLVTAMLMVMTYLLNKRWTFREQQALP